MVKLDRFHQYVAGSLLGAVLWLGANASAVRAEPPVAERIKQLELQDARGSKLPYDTMRGNSKLVVFAFLGTECPLAKLYAARLQELSTAYPPEQVKVIGVNSNSQDSLAEINAFVSRHKLTYPMVKDASHELADVLGATRTPEVFVLDQNQQIRYQGRIDDKYQIGVVRDRPTREDLKVALDELLAGKSVTVARTERIGCMIGRTRKPNDQSPVTYSNQIARIFQAHCVDCHRKGDIGPFEMTSYEDLRGWGDTIAEVVSQNRMPPWTADPEYGTFVNDCRLSEEDKQLIQMWVANGCPEGDPKDLPEPKVYVDGWQLPRQPDRIIPMAKKAFQVPADAGPQGVRYQNFWIDPKLTEDLWVEGLEVRPGNRAVVHHIIAYLHPEGHKGKKNSLLAAYVPGLRLENGLPEGAAKRIPAGSWLRFQIHYTPIGTEQEDLSVLGWLEANPDRVSQEVITAEAVQTGLEIKPKLADQKFQARTPVFQKEAQLLSLSPHMHLRGQSFLYELLDPDGKTATTLLSVPKYDFNWQTRYVLAKPITIPVGSRIRCTAHFDNSENNPNNPDPGATVHWGDQSWDEMMIGYFDLVLPKTDQGAGGVFTNASLLSERIDIKEAFAYLDKDLDGFLSLDECKKFPILEKGFPRIDTNGDGRVDAKELEEAFKKYGMPQ